MQLLVLLILLAYGGKTDKLKEVRPLLESIGGDEMKSALKDAEELSTVLSAVQSAAQGENYSSPDVMDVSAAEDGDSDPIPNNGWRGFPLAPVANIADEGITYSLSRYMSLDI